MDDDEAASNTELSQREREIVQLLARGWTNSAIASKLGITERTVLHHVGTAKDKLGCKTRPHLVALALKRGLIQ